MKLKGARIVLRLLLLIFFAAGFFSAARLLTPLHRLLVRLQLAPALLRIFASSGAAAIGALVVVLLLISLNLLFGRVYCGILCPLGLMQDLLGRLRRRPFRRLPPLRILHYLTGVSAAAAASLGIMALLNLLGPYALFGRFMRDLSGPLSGMIINGVGEILFSVGIYLQPFQSTVDPEALILTGALFLLLSAAILSRGRIFCNTLCPSGALLRAAAEKSLFAVRLNHLTCIGCGACERVCPAGCIDLTVPVVDSSRCVLCLDCLEVCPVGAIAYRRRPAEQPVRSETTPPINRRRFLHVLAGAGTALFVGCTTDRSSPRSLENGSMPEPASPPGSTGITRFTSNCIACHLCVGRCPTGVLQPGLFDYGFAGINQPVMDFAAGFCEYECVICSEVCPTGAILPLKGEEKIRVQIGEALFIQDRCIVFTNGTACGACAEVCPTGAVHMVPYRGFLTQPVTSPAVCIGCGHCENACPSEPKKAILVTGRRSHTRALAALPKSDTGTAAQELKVETGNSGEEFPF